jgi:hypothetical protein
MMQFPLTLARSSSKLAVYVSTATLQERASNKVTLSLKRE